jgi:predicted secreted hydrolase
VKGLARAEPGAAEKNTVSVLLRRLLHSRCGIRGSKWRLAILTVLAVSPFMLALAPAASFRLALPGYQFSFPRDHYSHEEFRTEWWYYTGHLRAASGGEYGYQLTFFRSALAEARANPSRWAARNLYLAHFAISDVGRRRFTYAERVSRERLGQAGAREDAFRVWNGDWEASGDGTTQRLRARDGSLGLDLTLAPVKPPVVHGENGVSRKGEGRGHASHYYSLTRLESRGSLTLAGRELAVSGQSWMDHEFGSTQLGPGQVGWDWFSLQLDDGTELMLYLIRLADGSADPHSAGTWVGPQGAARHLGRSEFAVEVLDRWRSPRGGTLYPMRWRVSVPSLDLRLTVTPAFPEQELDTAKSTQVVYWEGAARVQGTTAGRPVEGRAYVEMTGYAGPFRKRL